MLSAQSLGTGNISTGNNSNAYSQCTLRSSRALATLSPDSHYLEMSERSLIRALNKECDGVTVLMLDSNGHECNRCQIPLDVLPDYLYLRAQGKSGACLAADIVNDARCRHADRGWSTLY